MVRCSNPMCYDDMCLHPYPGEPEYETARKIREEYRARGGVNAMFWQDMKNELENPKRNARPGETKLEDLPTIGDNI